MSESRVTVHDGGDELLPTRSRVIYTHFRCSGRVEEEYYRHKERPSVTGRIAGILRSRMYLPRWSGIMLFIHALVLSTCSVPIDQLLWLRVATSSATPGYVPGHSGACR